MDTKNVIEDMIARFGTSGSERMEVVNHYMEEIIEVLISDIHKYFLNSSIFSKHHNSPKEPRQIDR